MAVLPTDYTDSTTPTGATTEYPATTTRGLNATHTQINTNTTDLAAKASLTGAETLTNKTLTSPKVNRLYDTNGNLLLETVATASAVNYAYLANNSAGGYPTIGVAGADTDIGLILQPKGAGAIFWKDGNGATVIAPAGVTSAVNYVIVQNAATLGTPNVTSWGSDTNVDLGLTTKGSGVVKANNVEVATISGAQTLTNKTISSTSNTITGLTTGNTSQQSQVVVSATAYYIAGSAITVPTNLTANVSRFRWTVAMAKTAAGTGTFEIIVYRGTNGTTADTADVAQSIGTQTAVADNMTLDVEILVTTTGATGAYYWAIIPTSKAASATGFGVPAGPTGQFSSTKSSVAMNTASLKFGLGFRATTGTPTVTVPLVRSQAYV